MSTLLLALDTATDITTVGLAWKRDKGLEMFAAAVVDAPRAAMSRVLPAAHSLLSANGLVPADVGEVVVGRGPGSFTGVRIGVATAKGLAHGLGVPLHGVGTLDAVAWGLTGTEGVVGVLGDAMRGEVYPALFHASGGLLTRLTPDRVEKPEAVAGQWAALGEPMLLVGNGLRKYAPVFREALGASATFAPEEQWPPYARGLFFAYAAAWRDGELGSGDPGAVLPVYTRLSDAEEAEAARRGESPDASTPASGVAGGERP